MSSLTTAKPVDAAAIESVLISGDLKALSTTQRLGYYNAVCESIGLNPLTKPFEYIVLNGKLTLYTRRDATDQLRKNQKVSITITAREHIGDVYVVTARARTADGREDESTGAVSIASLKGEMLANAFMKAETKAKRRVTLSICGLGMLDETEVETIIEAKPYQEQANPLKEIREAKKKVEEDPGEFAIPFGKFRGQKIKSVDVFELDGYVKYITQQAETNGKPIQGQVAEFMTNATLFLSMRTTGFQDAEFEDTAYEIAKAVK